MQQVTDLNLGWCDIAKAGFREIAKGLLQNTSLKTLTLWPPLQKTTLEAEVKRLKRTELFTPQSSSRLEIKTQW